jgi:hypothetical protein
LQLKFFIISYVQSEIAWNEHLYKPVKMNGIFANYL